MNEKTNEKAVTPRPRPTRRIHRARSEPFPLGSFVMAHAISSTHQCFYSEACLSNGVGIHQDDQYEPPASLSETYLIAKAAHFLTRDSQAPERSSQPQQLSLPIEHGFANDHRVASAPKRTGERSKLMSHVLVSASES